MITTTIEIKYVENSFETLNSIEVDLNSILTEEFNLGFPSDINSGF